jgi:hypothetical protein
VGWIHLEGTLVKIFALPTVIVTGLAAAIAGLVAATSDVAGSARADTWETTPPTVAFSGPAPPASNDPAQTVVSNLQSSGYRVILNKIGTAPLDQCKVTSVSPGNQVITPVTAGAGSLSWKVQYTTVYVTADCHTPATPKPAKPAGG